MWSAPMSMPFAMAAAPTSPAPADRARRGLPEGQTHHLLQRRTRPADAFRASRGAPGAKSKDRGSAGERLSTDRDAPSVYGTATALAYRGYKKGIETYVNPWAAHDPGQPQVTAGSPTASTWTARSRPPTSTARMARRVSTMRCIAPGAATRPGAATAMPRWTCAPTTRCRTAFTPWSSASRATRTR